MFIEVLCSLTIIRGVGLCSVPRFFTKIEENSFMAFSFSETNRYTVLVVVYIVIVLVLVLVFRVILIAKVGLLGWGLVPSSFPKV